METCEQHQTVVTDLAIIKNDIAYIKDKFCSHIKEGEEKGGYRDRLIIVEQEVSALKKAAWGRTVVAGLIGGLIGNLAPEAVNLLAKWVIGH